MPTCGTRTSAKELEAAVLSVLSSFCQEGRLAALARREAESLQQEQSEAGAELQRLESELAKQDREEEKVADLALVGVAPHIIRKKLEAVHARRDALTKELARALADVENPHSPDEAAEEAEAVAAEIREALLRAQTDPGAVRDVFRFVRVFIYRDRVPDIQIVSTHLTPKLDRLGRHTPKGTIIEMVDWLQENDAAAPYEETEQERRIVQAWRELEEKLGAALGRWPPETRAGSGPFGTGRSPEALASDYFPRE